jgi:hypothetical protein
MYCIIVPSEHIAHDNITFNININSTTSYTGMSHLVSYTQCHQTGHRMRPTSNRPHPTNTVSSIAAQERQ